jgi:acetyltransferase-like isoleucine patch superfamily enzyme
MSGIKKIFKYIKYIPTVFSDIIKFFIIYIPGPTGRKIRYLYWKNKFKRCGKNVYIDEGVIIQNPEWISIGDNVWIDKYCILMAGPVNMDNRLSKKRENKNFKYQEGELIIGSGIHIGINSIIQAHGGVYIGNNVTMSAGVKIYSLSNMVTNPHNLSMPMYANFLVKEQKQVGYIVSPIVIEDGVWIGLNSIVLGGSIGKNSFVAPYSLVLYDIEENSYASGNPAKKIKERFKMEEK